MTALTFGQTLTAHSAAPVELAVSGDGKAFTLTYSDYQVQLNNGPGRPSVMSARWEWFSVPISTHQHSDPFTVAVSGFASTQSGTPGARASLLISVNGQVDVKAFAAGFDDSFVQTVNAVTSGLESELQIAIGIVADGDRGFPAVIAVASVDGNTAV
jgi:hypothetical protein